MKLDKTTKTELTNLGVEVLTGAVLKKTGIDVGKLFAAEYSGLWLKIVAIVRNYIERKRFAKANNESKKVQGLLFLMGQGSEKKEGTEAEHPLHQIRLAKYAEEASFLTKAVRVNFGDSLTDLARDQLQGEYIDCIWSIAGSISPNMSQMANAMKGYMKGKTIKHISVGSINGNSFLAGFDYDWILNQSRKDLDKIRAAYKDVKITVYGLPPTFNVYATEKYIEYDAFLYDWCVRDGNANFVSFKKLGNGLFPSVDYSADGVHLTPKAAVNFGEALKEAYVAPAGSIIFVNRKTNGVEKESINLLLNLIS